jgi:DNA-binding IclR family transcriptional regulator
MVGIAAPITVMDRALLGSLSLVIPASRLDATLERRLVLLVVSSAKLLTSELTAQHDRAAVASRR